MQGELFKQIFSLATAKHAALKAYVKATRRIHNLISLLCRNITDSWPSSHHSQSSPPCLQHHLLHRQESQEEEAEGGGGQR